MLPPLAEVFSVKPELLMALAISPAVTNLPASAADGAVTLPLAAFAKVTVLAFTAPVVGSVVRVVPSVFTLMAPVVPSTVRLLPVFTAKS